MMQTSPSHCLQDTKENIEEEPYSDYEDTDSELSDSELSAEEEIEGETEKKLEGEIEEELEEEIEEEFEEEIEKKLEEEIEEELEEEIEEEFEEEIEKKLEEEIEEELEGEIEEELEEEIEEELEEEIEEELEEEIEEELEEEIEEELEGEIEEELEEEIEEELEEEIEEELEEEIEEELEEEIEEELEEEIEEELEGEIEEELEEEIEEELEEEIEEELEGEIEEELEEEIEKETLQDIDCLSDAVEASVNMVRSLSNSTLDGIEELDFAPSPDAERLRKSQLSLDMDLQKAIPRESGATTALEVNVSSVKGHQAQTEEDLKKERIEKDALNSMQEKPESNRIRAKLEYMKAQIAAFRRLVDNNQDHKKHQLASENKREGSKLEDSPHMGQLVQKDQAQFLRINTNLERLKKAPADTEGLLDDKETQRLQNITGTLEATEGKRKETLPEKDDNIFKSQATFANSGRKKAHMPDALNQSQKDADKLDNLTHENQQLASENMRLQSKLEDAVREIQAAREAAISQQRKLDHLTKENLQLACENKRVQEHATRQHQEDREACSRLEVQVKKENARFLQACKKLKMLKKAPESVETLMYDMETLKMENKHITGKLEDLEVQFSVQREEGLAQQHKVLAEKDDIISKNQAINAKLQHKVNKLKEQLSESKNTKVQLENALNQEKIQKAVLEERGKHIASTLKKEKRRTIRFANALQKERATNKSYSVELMEAKINNVKLQERQNLSPFLKTAQSHLRQPQQSDFSSGNNNDIVLKMNETTNAIENLQKMQRNLYCSFQKIVHPTPTQEAGAAVDGPEVL